MRARAGLVATWVLVSGQALAADYYVAPTGNDTSPGSMAQPFATLQKGNDVAQPGDTIWLRGGTYQVGKQIKLSKSGQSDALRIKYFAYQGEKPVLDFATYKTTNAGADVEAVAITGSWLHLKGLEVKNVPMDGDGAHSNSGVRSRGASNNTFELLDIHHIRGPGLFIDGGQGGNLILNCDSHDNYDKNGSQGDGQNGDGFGVHYQMTGPSTVIRGCRAWYNSDDGYDFISQEVPVTTENSWAMYNGLAEGGTVKPADGNGNGFKAGSSKNGIRHLLRNCVAWKNTAAGFYANHSSGGNTWYNNTSWSNGVAYNMLASPPDDTSATITLSGDKVHIMRNNIGFPNKNTNMQGVDTKSNSWDLSLTPTNDDFASTSDAECMGPRQANGSMPATQFLHLKQGSKLIDKGEDVKLAFVGNAPDLGAYEYGAPDPMPSGGSSGGAAGGTSVAGAAGSDTGGVAGNASSGGQGGSGVTPNGGSSAQPVAGSAPATAGSSASSGGSGSGVAGSVSAAGSDAGPTAMPEDSSGCTCRAGVGGSSGNAWSLSLLAALGVLAARRRNPGAPADGANVPVER
jgi:hypothetical protein